MATIRKQPTTLIKQQASFQPGLALSVLGLALVGGGLYFGANASSSTTTSVCHQAAVSNINTATPQSNQVFYSVTSQGQGKVATAYVKAGSKCVGFNTTFVSYTAPAANGLPRTKQVIYQSVTKAMTSSVSTYQVLVPNCYYQIDLAYGSPMIETSGNDYSGPNFLWGVTGGSNSCDYIHATPTPTPVVVYHTPTPTPVVVYHTPTPRPTPTPVVVYNTPTPRSTPTKTPVVTPMPSPTPSPMVTPIPIGVTPTQTPAPGESTVIVPASAKVTVLPQTGSSGYLLSLIGLLLVTAGLISAWKAQKLNVIGSKLK